MSETQRHLMTCPKCEGHGYRGPDGCGHCGSTGRMAVVAASDLALMEARKDDAYLERNRCVALVARMALAMGLPVAVAKTAIEGWSEDWHGCIYIGLPTGQVSWHFHDSQAHLFEDLPKRQEEWDGHDTPEKYRRVDAAFAVDAAQPPQGIKPVADVVAHPAYRAEFVPVIKVRPDHGMKHGDVLYRCSDVTRILLADWSVQKDRTEQILALQSEVARLKSSLAVMVADAADCEVLRKDAERYRWLRGRIPGGTYRVMGVVYSEGGAGVDAAIDAAMAPAATVS